MDNVINDNEKFKQMYFYALSHFKGGVTKTKLAKLLYLADFSYFYDNLESMSGVRYVRREYDSVDDMVKPTTIEKEYDLLTGDEKELLDKICCFWKDKRTTEIVNFTHEQKPWKACRDGEYIPYSLIIQENPNHVYAPID